jgi:hypothetical protein
MYYTRWIGPRTHHDPKPCTSGQFFSRSDVGAAAAESKNCRHPRPHPRHKSGTPPVVSPTRTPAISVTHVYRSSAGSTNGGPSRAHVIAAPDPTDDGDVWANGGADATPQCRGDGQRPKHFCSCAASTTRDPRTLSAALTGAEENIPAPPALTLVVVARENACRRGADTAAGATRAKRAASAGESAPSWSGSWKRSSSVVGWYRVRKVVAVGCGASERCWFIEDGVRR